jgi:hypothetical protein
MSAVLAGPAAVGQVPAVQEDMKLPMLDDHHKRNPSDSSSPPPPDEIQTFQAKEQVFAVL